MPLVMQVTDRAFSFSAIVRIFSLNGEGVASWRVRAFVGSLIYIILGREGVIKGQDRTFDAEKRRKLEVYVPCT